jgi:hypothetical protein
MASALFIKPMVFNQLSEEQILTWRKETYSRLKEYITYSPNDMLSIKPTKITTLESMSISMKNKLISFRTTNELKFSKSIFIMIDSCILGKKTIPTIISDLKQKIWTIDEQIQSECPHEHTYPIDFFVECHKCSACGIFLIKRS